MARNGEMKYGLFDYAGQCWLGKDDGPLKYTERRLARAAATIMTERMGTLVMAYPIPCHVTQFKDTIEVEMTAEEAMKRIEKKVKKK
jgi:hypothetical protein